MDDNQLLRYSRHILLPQIGIEGQQKLLSSHVLVAGAGGLGSPAAIYLATCGVGRITVCDGDIVDLTNLQRQIIHASQSVGLNKALSAQQTINRINPEVTVTAIPRRLQGEELLDFVAEADVVIDATDNFASRHAINRACVRHRKPLVSGAAIRFEGQVAVFDLRQKNNPCYHCLYQEDGTSDEAPCAIMGVFAPVTGIIGTIQAAEALKILLGSGVPLAGRLLLLDTLSMDMRTVRFHKDQDCPVCNHAT